MLGAIITAYVQIVRTNHIFGFVPIDEIPILCTCFDEFIVIFNKYLCIWISTPTVFTGHVGMMSVKKRALVYGYTHARYPAKVGTQTLE